MTARGEITWKFAHSYVRHVAVHRAVRGSGFEEDQPILVGHLHDEVGHLPVGVNEDTETLQRVRGGVRPLGVGVADVEDDTARSVVATEVLHNRLDQDVLSSGA